MTEGRGRLLVAGFSPGPAGIGWDMLNLMNGCAGAGVEVHALVETDDNPDLEYLDGSVRRQVRYLGEGRVAIARMQDLLRALRPDAVIVNKDRMGKLLVDAVEGLELRPRILVRVGSNLPAKLRHRNPVSRWRSRRRLLATYPRADVLVGVSQGVCDGLRELLGDTAPPIRCIYNSMDVTGIKVRSLEEPTHPWFRERRGRLLASVGRLARSKDQETMLRALTRLPKDYRLVIFGEGRQRPRLEALVQELGLGDRVDLPGYASNPFAHVARADLFLLSSRFEGFPNALLEATALGIPAVSTDCPSGPHELLDGGRYGELVPIGDALAMAAAIRRILNKPPTKAQLAMALDRLTIHCATDLFLDALGFGVLTSADHA